MSKRQRWSDQELLEPYAALLRQSTSRVVERLRLMWTRNNTFNLGNSMNAAMSEQLIINNTYEVNKQTTMTGVGSSSTSVASLLPIDRLVIEYTLYYLDHCQIPSDHYIRLAQDVLTGSVERIRFASLFNKSASLPSLCEALVEENNASVIESAMKEIEAWTDVRATLGEWIANRRLRNANIDAGVNDDMSSDSDGYKNDYDEEKYDNEEEEEEEWESQYKRKNTNKYNSEENYENDYNSDRNGTDVDSLLDFVGFLYKSLEFWVRVQSFINALSEGFAKMNVVKLQPRYERELMVLLHSLSRNKTHALSTKQHHTQTNRTIELPSSAQHLQSKSETERKESNHNTTIIAKCESVDVKVKVEKVDDRQEEEQYLEQEHESHSLPNDKETFNINDCKKTSSCDDKTCNDNIKKCTFDTLAEEKSNSVENNSNSKNKSDILNTNDDSTSSNNNILINKGEGMANSNREANKNSIREDESMGSENNNKTTTALKQKGLFATSIEEINNTNIDDTSNNSHCVGEDEVSNEEEQLGTVVLGDTLALSHCYVQPINHHRLLLADNLTSSSKFTSMQSIAIRGDNNGNYYYNNNNNNNNIIINNNNNNVGASVIAKYVNATVSNNDNKKWTMPSSTMQSQEATSASSEQLLIDIPDKLRQELCGVNYNYYTMVHARLGMMITREQLRKFGFNNVCRPPELTLQQRELMETMRLQAMQSGNVFNMFGSNMFANAANGVPVDYIPDQSYYNRLLASQQDAINEDEEIYSDEVVDYYLRKSANLMAKTNATNLTKSINTTNRTNNLIYSSRIDDKDNQSPSQKQRGGQELQRKASTNKQLATTELIKPHRFCKVKTGYTWNQYNRTHYDSRTNPPPRTVLWYEFTLFYPALVNTKRDMRHIFHIEDTPRGAEDDYCLLVFSVGPPYADVAYRIVKKQWDTRKGGVRISFDATGRYKLFFRFTNSNYRR